MRACVCGPLTRTTRTTVSHQLKLPLPVATEHTHTHTHTQQAEYGHNDSGPTNSPGPPNTSSPGGGPSGGGGGKPTRPPRRPWTTLTGITLLRLYWWPMVHESLWVLVEVGQRLGTPVALREFLRWLQVGEGGRGVNFEPIP